MQYLEIEIRDDVQVIRILESRLMDKDKVQAVDNDLKSAFEDSYHKKVILDFSLVEFLSSYMAGKLFQLGKHCRDQGIKVRVCHLASNISEVFKVIKLNKLMPISKTISDAQSSLEGGMFSFLRR